MFSIDTSSALTVQSASPDAAAFAMDDLFGSLLASRAHFLTTLSASDELTQERFREQSLQLAELISDLGSIHRELIAERERSRDLKTGYEREVESFSEVIRDICSKVALAGVSEAEELTTDAAIVPATASGDIRRELTTLAAAVDALAQGFIKVSTKIDQEAVKLTAATSEVEVLKALLAAEKLEAENLKASHAAQVASISASGEARMRAVANSWFARGYDEYGTSSNYYMRKYQHLENKEQLKRSGIVTFQS